MPSRINSKSDVYYLILQTAHRMGMPRLKRHYEDGDTRFLGGFTKIHNGLPGWIATFDGDFYAVIAGQNGYYVRPADAVKWYNYAGDNSPNPLYQGDNPEQFKILKDEGVIWIKGDRPMPI